MEKERNNNDQSSSVRRCGQIGEGEDDELSMVDVLNEEARLRADADAVLGGSDPNNCTYPQGYLKRQALYACATCTPEGNAGVCLACSYACHEGHDLYELYTKRHFACDCGNAKFGTKGCSLYPGEKEMNARNRYDQNFRGVYCICSRPYPDPEDSIEDEMIQCIMCEDWYHGRHLKAPVPEDDDFQEMVCPDCMSKYSFLWAYYVKSEVTKVEAADTKSEVNEVNVEESPGKGQASTKASSPARSSQQLSPEVQSSSPGVPSSSPLAQSSTNSPGNSSKCWEDKSAQCHSGMKRKAEPSQGGQGPPAKCTKLDSTGSGEEQGEGKEEEEEECILRVLEKRGVDQPDAATFWPEGWRKKLCKCHNCMAMYKDRQIEFLLDEYDTVQAYESQGKSDAGSEQEDVDEASALAGMNRVQQIEMVRGFMDLKSELNEFLQGFARDGKVVKETDIREFFERMNQRRRRQLQMPQHSCR